MFSNDRTRGLLGNESTSLDVDDSHGYRGYNNVASAGTGRFRATKYCNLLWLVVMVLIFVITLVSGYEIGKRLASTSSGSDEPIGPSPPAVPSSTVTLLISIDGFRASYLTNYSTSIPTLLAVRDRGLSATRMQSSFPTTTFPNHWSIVTGLVTAHHGIISNNMFDPTMNATFSMSNAQSKNPAWWQGEPIWMTAKRSGLLSASMFWPGSEVPGLQPTYWRPFQQSLSNLDRVAQVLAWMDQKACTICTLYFDTVDTAGHNSGPNSTQVQNALSAIDSAIAVLIAGLAERQLLDGMSIVVVSDHGMSEISPSTRSVFLNTVTDTTKFFTEDTGAFLGIWPNTTTGGNVTAIYNDIKALPHTSIWLKEDIPEIYRYGGKHYDNVRIPPIVGIADDGWVISTSSSRPYSGRGTHGYDPQLASMGALFLAQSPMLKPGLIDTFDNINVYSLLCHLIGLGAQGKCAATDGSLDVFRPYLL